VARDLGFCSSRTNDCSVGIFDEVHVFVDHVARWAETIAVFRLATTLLGETILMKPGAEIAWACGSLTEYHSALWPQRRTLRGRRP
jgi:hypothetical protein